MCKLLIKRRKAGTAGATLRLRLLLVVLLLWRRWRKVRGKARRPCQTRRPSDGLYGSSWNHVSEVGAPLAAPQVQVAAVGFGLAAPAAAVRGALPGSVCGALPAEAQHVAAKHALADAARATTGRRSRMALLGRARGLLPALVPHVAAKHALADAARVTTGRRSRSPGTWAEHAPVKVAHALLSPMAAQVQETGPAMLGGPVATLHGEAAAAQGAAAAVLGATAAAPTLAPATRPGLVASVWAAALRAAVALAQTAQTHVMRRSPLVWAVVVVLAP